MRERERERDTDRERKRQTDRQTDRMTHFFFSSHPHLSEALICWQMMNTLFLSQIVTVCQRQMKSPPHRLYVHWLGLASSTLANANLFFHISASYGPAGNNMTDSWCSKTTCHFLEEFPVTLIMALFWFHICNYCDYHVQVAICVTILSVQKQKVLRLQIIYLPQHCWLQQGR